MPRYFFTIHDGLTIPDPVGHLLPNLEAAKQEAVTIAADMIRRHARHIWNGKEWRMEVTDEIGLTLFSLIFYGMLSPAAQARSHLD